MNEEPHSRVQLDGRLHLSSSSKPKLWTENQGMRFERSALESMWSTKYDSSLQSPVIAKPRYRIAPLSQSPVVTKPRYCKDPMIPSPALAKVSYRKAPVLQCPVMAKPLCMTAAEEGRRSKTSSSSSSRVC
eukprot:1660249-Rhodomonas_salina.1